MSDLRNGVRSYGLNTLLISFSMVIVYLIVGCISSAVLGEWHSLGVVPRIIGFVSICVAVFVSAPIKLYGKITSKQDGTFFLSIPVSSFEKTSSIILNSIVIFPLIVVAMSLGIDWLLCKIDHGCGMDVISAISYFISELGEEIQMSGATFDDGTPIDLSWISGILNPLMFIDDFMQVGFYFLLGALFFKSNKFIKTVLVLIGMSFALQIITGIGGTLLAMTVGDVSGIGEYVLKHMSWLFNHLVVIDCISDTIFNLAFAGIVFLRIKTLKH
ncbi:MAG: hypothetical protein MJY67_04710 [Bacteroidales bacterium]|nr:hypothetical protein [Bacteroidales bacterium]